MESLAPEQFEQCFTCRGIYLDIIMPLNHPEHLNTDTILLILEGIYCMHMKIFEVFGEQKISHLTLLIEQQSRLSQLLTDLTSHANVQVQSLVFQIIDECLLFRDPL